MVDSVQFKGTQETIDKIVKSLTSKGGKVTKDTRPCTIEDIKDARLLTCTSEHYNGGREFTGRIESIRGESVLLKTKNGRSRKWFELSQLNIKNITK